jgi:hypothetical protein
MRRSVVARGRGREIRGAASGKGVPFASNKNVLELIAVMAAQSVTGKFH